MDSSGVETDAVHHRLSDKVNVAYNFLYECYDCFECFSHLEDLARHTIENACHSEEMCLKCKQSVTVLLQSRKVARLHSCQKSELCHQFSDLYFHSRFLASKLQLDQEIIVGCELRSCTASFEPSADGIYKFLKHSNKYRHFTVPSCKKCSLPEFQLTVGGLKTISHYCLKVGKVVYVAKPNPVGS